MAKTLKSVLNTLKSAISGGSELVWRAADNEAVMAIGADGRIIAATASVETVISRTPDQLTGRLFEDFVLSEDRVGLKAVISGLGAARSETMELRMIKPGGGGLWIDVSLRQENGGLMVLLRPSAAAHARARALREAEEAAREEASIRADMLADLSHEMKTPLNAIIGFADAMREKTFGDLGHRKYDEYAELIHGSGDHLLSLISSVLDLAKIEAGRYQLSPVSAKASSLARDCAEMMRLQAEEAGLKLIVESGETPISLIDPRAVRQILLNLLTNAIKFTSDGEIRVSSMLENDQIVLTVSDTGVGMSKEQLSRLGSRFTQAHSNGVRGTGGTGLGLNLVSALAELHGGRLEIESAPGEGVIARVTLPFRAPVTARGESSSSTSGAPRVKRADADIMTQLERIEAFRQEREASAA